MKRKYKKETEEVNDNVSAFMDWLIAKVNFLNQAESFMSESCISQFHGNAHNKTRKWRYFN